LHGSLLPLIFKQVDLEYASMKAVRIRKKQLKAEDPMSRIFIRKENHMLYTIALILGVLWVLGLATGYTAGYFIHILLVVAVAMVLLNIFQGRRSV